MEKMIVVGNDLFESFIRDNGYYVDKSEIIYELVTQTRNKVTMFTRPRRFGKTLTMSMMESFFDVRRDSQELFQGLDVLQNHPEFCRAWMNQYPVLFLTFKDVEGLTFDAAFKMLKSALSDVCKKHAYLLEDKRAAPNDALMFSKLKSETAELVDVKNSLQTIMRMMNAVYGKPVILEERVRMEQGFKSKWNKDLN